MQDTLIFSLLEGFIVYSYMSTIKKIRGMNGQKEICKMWSLEKTAPDSLCWNQIMCWHKAIIVKQISVTKGKPLALRRRNRTDAMRARPCMVKLSFANRKRLKGVLHLESKYVKFSSTSVYKKTATVLQKA